MGYFEVYLKDIENMRILMPLKKDFNKLCNHIDYSDPNLCKFMHDDKDGTYTCLAFIPYQNIFCIVNKESDICE